MGAWQASSLVRVADSGCNYGSGQTRQTIRLGKISAIRAESLKEKIEALAVELEHGFGPQSYKQYDWLKKVSWPIRKRLIRVGLILPTSHDEIVSDRYVYFIVCEAVDEVKIGSTTNL